MSRKRLLQLNFQHFVMSALSLHQGHPINQAGKCLFSRSPCVSSWPCAGRRMERHRLHNRASNTNSMASCARRGGGLRINHPFVGPQCKRSLAMTSNPCMLSTQPSGRKEQKRHPAGSLISELARRTQTPSTMLLHTEPTATLCNTAPAHGYNSISASSTRSRFPGSH